jgi:hypothetical protein
MNDQAQLLKEVALTYARNRRLADECSARGDEEKRDEHFSVLQQMERDITIIENGRSWRQPVKRHNGSSRTRR